jgi:hypothetical protein
LLEKGGSPQRFRALVNMSGDQAEVRGLEEARTATSHTSIVTYEEVLERLSTLGRLSIERWQMEEDSLVSSAARGFFEQWPRGFRIAQETAV